MTNCNSVTTPTETRMNLQKDSAGKWIDNIFYKQFVESLMYLTTNRRYNVLFKSHKQVHEMSKRISLPGC